MLPVPFFFVPDDPVVQNAERFRRGAPDPDAGAGDQNNFFYLRCYRLSFWNP
jgi:hypothetical protein